MPGVPIGCTGAGLAREIKWKVHGPGPVNRVDMQQPQRDGDAMGYEQLEQQLSEFDTLLADLNLNIPDASPLAPYFATTREFLNDRQELDEKALVGKWNLCFPAFYDGQIVTKRLSSAALLLQNQTALRGRLKTVLAGDLGPNSDPDHAKDIFYELELAADFSDAGLTVTLREPDIAISGCGLTAQYGVACKYPSSEKQIHSHLSKGYSQLTKQNLAGFVAIGFDLLVFGDFPGFVDFRQGNRHPLDVMQSAMNSAMMDFVNDRRQNYPSEDPIDGALFTLRASGIYGAPAQLTTVTAITMQCESANPMFADIARIRQQLQTIANKPS